jgi:hypothetical protein
MIACASLILFCGGSRNKISLRSSRAFAQVLLREDETQKKIFAARVEILDSTACVG